MSKKEESSGELIIQEPQPDLSIFGHDKAVFLTSIPASGRELWALSAKMQGSGIEGLQDHVNEPFTLVNWFVHKVRVRNVNTGEMVAAVRSVLMSADGKLYDTVSDGIANSLAQIVQAFGIKPLTPPLKVVAKAIETRAGFRTLVLEAAE